MYVTWERKLLCEIHLYTICYTNKKLIVVDWQNNVFQWWSLFSGHFKMWHQRSSSFHISNIGDLSFISKRKVQSAWKSKQTRTNKEDDICIIETFQIITTLKGLQRTLGNIQCIWVQSDCSSGGSLKVWDLLSSDLDILIKDVWSWYYRVNSMCQWPIYFFCPPFNCSILSEWHVVH